MKKFNFYNQGQSLIGIIIVLAVVGLINGSLYYYLSKQIPEVPEIPEKPTEEVVKPEEKVTPSAEGMPKEEIAPKEKVEEKITEPKEKPPTTPEITCQNECSPLHLTKCVGKDFQVCGYYDKDNCLEWGPVINCPISTTCQNGSCVLSTVLPTVEPEEPVAQRCADGTPFGQCSTVSKGEFCDNGELKDYCERCGCPSDKICFTYGSWPNYNSVCKPPVCKNDKDCDDKNSKTRDKCLSPSTAMAECYHSLQARGRINVGVVEFAPQNVVYGNTSYAYLKKTFGNCPFGFKSGGLGYYWFNGLTNSDECYDVISTYSFLELFNNPAKSVSKYVDSLTYNITQSGNETLHSIYYIKDWYEKEAAKYGLTDFSMNIEVKGPYILSTDPPAGGRWGSEGACNPNLTQFFINEGGKIGIEEKNYDIIMYIYFSDWQLSHRSYQGFTSCADMVNSRIFANVPTFEYPEETGNIVMLMHEIGHAFWALDYYTSPCYVNSELQSCCKEPEGIPEPNKVPKYPQTKACLMCSIIQSSDPRLESGTGLSNVDLAVICDVAAEEIGWK